MKANLLLASLLAFALSSIAQASEVYCSIEIGAKGVKARAYELEESDDEITIDTHFTNEINTFLASGSKDGKYSDEAINRTSDAVATLMNEMKTRVGECRPLVVGSSGAANASNAQDLANQINQRMNIDFRFVTADEEGRYGFMSAVPRKHWKSALLVDTGSGNTKLAYLGVGNRTFHKEIPYGSSTLSKALQEQNVEGTLKAFDRAIEKLVGRDYRESIESMPALNNRKIIYWIGGAAWATATYTHPELSARGIVSISFPDLVRFRKALDSKEWIDGPQIPAQITPKNQQAFEKDWRKIPDIFTRENLMSGTGIMYSILNTDTQRNAIYFPRNANWVYGYTLEKFKQR